MMIIIQNEIPLMSSSRLVHPQSCQGNREQWWCCSARPLFKHKPWKVVCQMWQMIPRQIMNVCTALYGMPMVFRNLQLWGSSWNCRDFWGFKDRACSSMSGSLEDLVFRWWGQQLTKNRTDVLWSKPMECQWHYLTSLEDSVAISLCGFRIWMQQAPPGGGAANPKAEGKLRQP